MTSVRTAWLIALALCACSSDPPPPPPPPTTPAALLGTLTDLATFGNKRVGTLNDAHAADYLKGRMTALGLADVHFETFQVPREDITSKALAVTINGVAAVPAFAMDVFEASSPGHADADVVYVHDAAPSALVGVDLTGKIALVERNLVFHRSTQYRNVAAKGAVAMLYISAAPQNLLQVGSVKRDWETFGPIPAVTIGATDGKALIDALGAAQPVHAVIDVGATSTPATGRNVVGRIAGRDPDGGQIVIGAHYDTWFTGSTDNGGGVAALLALAERRTHEAQPFYTLVFVAYDGEEVALYGGYDYLRKHQVVAHDPIMAVLNFEMPAALDSGFVGLAHSALDALDQALQDAGLRSLYALYLDMEIVPSLFGGIIPTDIQGIYRSGVPTASTASDTPYYHTIEDTPDKVDTARLASDVDAFDDALALLDVLPHAAFAAPNPKLWRATVSASVQAGSLALDGTISDSAGAVQSGAPVHVVLLHDDFFLSAAHDTTTDAQGRIHVTFTPAESSLGAGARYVHVTAGPSWPLVEKVVAVP